ncbi:MAG TPA: hypothetical protein VFB29_00375 [Pseudolabrys sp.]|nr:hypothetical protein [Pseudolabrys sp.]
MVRAKFFVTSIQHFHGTGTDPCAEVKLAPVFGSYGNGEENKSFSKYTPQGTIALTITNPDAIDKFSLGEAYYVDFTPAPK